MSDDAPVAPRSHSHALNPNYRVPVTDDDGFILSESMAINFHLAKKHKNPLYRALTIDLGKWPHVQAWLNRCWERPPAKQARAMREK